MTKQSKLPSAWENICTQVYGILAFGEEIFVLKFTDHVLTLVPSDTVAPSSFQWYTNIWSVAQTRHAHDLNFCTYLLFI